MFIDIYQIFTLDVDKMLTWTIILNEDDDMLSGLKYVFFTVIVC